MAAKMTTPSTTRDVATSSPSFSVDPPLHHDPSDVQSRMRASLRQRLHKGTLRTLPATTATTDNTAPPPHQPHQQPPAPLDFASNDYLGLARSVQQAQRVEALLREATHPLPPPCDINNSSHNNNNNATTTPLLGATGSRLLSGDAPAFHRLEAYLANLHQQPAALLCNSGYDANLALVSSLPCDVILYDDLAHNSLHMGMRLWQWQPSPSPQQQPQQSPPQQQAPSIRRTAVSFRHNDVADLTHKLQHFLPHTHPHHNRHSHHHPAVVILVESVYSMDGDTAPLRQILDLAQRYGAHVVVDEAHGLGVCGPTGLLAAQGLADHAALLAAVYTFGKAAGCHGAVVTGSSTLKAYLTNFGYPFIYSTALPRHSLCSIQAAYETMTSARGDALRAHLNALIALWQTQLPARLAREHPDTDIYMIPSHTAIQALVVPGNQRCTAFCNRLWRLSRHRIRLFPIKSPTVPRGQERVRIVLHAHNTRAQVLALMGLLLETIRSETESSLVGSGDGDGGSNHRLRAKL